jgi:urease accessory protein UreH
MTEATLIHARNREMLETTLMGRPPSHENFSGLDIAINNLIRMGDELAAQDQQRKRSLKRSNRN